MENTKLESVIHKFYWNDDINCATTTMKVLADNYSVVIDKQVIDSLIGMHGAGKYGAQCGLVEGALMFIGIFGRIENLKDEIIIKHCYRFAEEFEKVFTSLNCKDLRLEGFKAENPPHLCEELTKKSLLFTLKFMEVMGLQEGLMNNTI